MTTTGHTDHLSGKSGPLDVGPPPYCPACGAPSTQVVAVQGLGVCRLRDAALAPVRLSGGGVGPWFDRLSELDPRVAAVRAGMR